MIFSRKKAIMLMAVLALAGCGNETKTPGVASAGGTPSAAASADVITVYVEGQRAWVKCLRAEGIEVSDPDPKGAVQFDFHGDPKAKANPKFLAAQKKCFSLQLPMPRELRDYPKLKPAEIEIGRRYAKCMQANGAPDYPDPEPDGYAPEPNPTETGFPAWEISDEGRRAQRICGPIIGEPATPGPAKG